MSYKNSTTNSHDVSKFRSIFSKLLEKNITEDVTVIKNLHSLSSNVTELHKKISTLDEKIKNAEKKIKE